MMNVYPHAIWGRSARERLPVVLTLACCAACSTSAAPATPDSASTEGPQSNDGAQLAEAAAVGQQFATPAAVNAGQCPRNPMIDDLEDGNAEITPAEGRDGSWYTYVDEEGSQIEPAAGSPFVPAEPGAAGPTRTARASGSLANGNVWAGLGLDLTRNKQPYDASCCQGISFRGRKLGPGTGGVRFKIGDVQTVPEGGVCSDCYNDFGAFLMFTEEWAEYSLPFEKLSQQSGWGQQFERLRSEAIYHVHFQAHHPNNVFDIVVDDIRFFGCGSAQ